MTAGTGSCRLTGPTVVSRVSGVAWQNVTDKTPTTGLFIRIHNDGRCRLALHPDSIHTCLSLSRYSHAVSDSNRSFLASDVYRRQTRKCQLSPPHLTSPSRGKRVETFLDRPSLHVECAVLPRPQPQFLRYSPLKQPIDPDLLLKDARPLSAVSCSESHIQQTSSNSVGMCQTSASSGYSMRSSITATWSHLQAPLRVTETRARGSLGSGANRLYPYFVRAVVACLSRMKAAFAEEQRRMNEALPKEQRSIKEILGTAALLHECGRSPDKGGCACLGSFAWDHHRKTIRLAH